MWHRVTITNPRECDFEYLNAFSQPVDGKVLMIPRESDCDIFLLDLLTMTCRRIINRRDIIRRYAEGEIMPGTTLEFQEKKYELLGLCGGYVLHQNLYGERIEIEKVPKQFGHDKYDQQLRFTVTTVESTYVPRSTWKLSKTVTEIKKLLEYQWKSYTWDWVTFTRDNDHILLGNAVGLDIFKRD